MADAPESFGAGLAARSRPRMAATVHVRRASAIGAVGRSTIGFGRIIATAGSARPVVTPDVLATRSLRPPVGAWSLFGADDVPEVGTIPWTTSAMPSATTPRRAPQPSPAPAPSATPAARPASKGAGKVDALRRLLEARGMIEPSEPAADVTTATSPSARTPAPAPAGRDAAAAGDRTATSAGADTAPGRFGRRVRPEPTTPESPLSSVFPEGVPSSRPTVRRSPQSSGPDDLDRFRRALEARGMMASSSEPTAARSPQSTPPAATPAPRPRASERSTPSRPASPRGVDADNDGEGVPAAPSRSLPFALAPESAPAPTRHLLRRAVAPGGLTPGRTPADDRAPSGFDATVGSSIAPSTVVPASAPPGTPTPATVTTPGSVTPGSITPATVTPGSVTPGTVTPGTVTPGTVTPGTVTPGTVTPIHAIRTQPASTPAARATVHPAADAAAPPIRRSEARRVELRRLAHRIGLDRTLTTISSTDSIASAPATAATHVRVAPPAGTPIESGDRSTAPMRRSPDGRPTAIAAATPGAHALTDVAPRTRAPIVVTRATEARAATRNVRHRMAGRRFLDTSLTTTVVETSPTDRVAPAATAAGATTGVTPTGQHASPDRSAVRRAVSPEWSPSRAPGGVERPLVRSAVAPGPGALRRALMPTSETATPSPRRSVAPTTAAPAHPVPTAESATSSSDRSTTPSRPSQPSQPTPVTTDTDHPTVPDPSDVAGTTAARLTSTAPAVVARAPEPTRREPVTTPAADRADRVDRGDLGERFLRELGRAPDSAARELPTPFQPLATAITGSARQVRVSSDRVSRRALESVGKEAVTVGDTIHIVRPPRGDARTTEVLAHELVHVAHPSPVPRFFDDDHRGPEERMAEQVAQVIARSPVMPSSPVPSNRAGGSGSDVVRRSPEPRRSAPTSGAPGAISAAALAGALEGHSSGAASSRAVSSGGRSSDTTVRRAADTSIRRSDRSNRDQQGEGHEGSGQLFGSGTREERDRFDALIERSIDRVVRRVEERVIAELERRGGRYWRNF